MRGLEVCGSLAESFGSRGERLRNVPEVGEKGERKGKTRVEGPRIEVEVGIWGGEKGRKASEVGENGGEVR